jgi:hypothetical protein
LPNIIKNIRNNVQVSRDAADLFRRFLDGAPELAKLLDLASEFDCKGDDGECAGYTREDFHGAGIMTMLEEFGVDEESSWVMFDD